MLKSPIKATVGLLCSLWASAGLTEEVKLTQAGITLNANLETTASWPAGPVVLLTHGTLAHRGMEIISTLQGMLQERGISSLAINLSLGLNDRAAAMYDCPTPHTHRHTDAVGEIGAWVDWLKGQGTRHIVLLGHSRGGNQTARFAAAPMPAEVESVVLLAPATWDADKAPADYQKRYGQPIEPLLRQAGELVDAGKQAELMGPMGFIYCENTRASAAAVVSYYSPDPDMDTPQVIPRIPVPVLVIAGSQDTVVAGLIDKMQPLADGDKVRLEVIDGADHFFLDLYSEEVADLIAETLAKP